MKRISVLTFVVFAWLVSGPVAASANLSADRRATAVIMGRSSLAG